MKCFVSGDSLLALLRGRVETLSRYRSGFVFSSSLLTFLKK